ncbi:MAG: hypothetical protein K0R78_3746, partial [Pelosinus sp.]|nr:hypothetical protein [Pelosinus sp.]
MDHLTELQTKGKNAKQAARKL